MVSINDVAKLAGVSNATVSRVFGKKEYVRKSTRERVLKAAAELDYKPNRVARSLRTRSSKIIGLIISDIQNPFFTTLVRAVEDVAYEHNYAVFLCNSDEDLNKEALYIELMISEKVAGVIIVPTREDQCSPQRLIDTGIPTVSVDRRVLGCEIDTVILDNIKGAYALVEHLIQHGHHRIGAILSFLEITTGRERLEGYKNALRDHGIALDPQLIKTGLPKEKIGNANTTELLNLPQPPSAIFAGNNLLAVGTIRAIYEFGLSIPEDISLVSFDDQEWATLMKPKITVAAQPTYELGQKAAELVMERINNDQNPNKLVMMEPKLHFRESVGPPITPKEVNPQLQDQY